MKNLTLTCLLLAVFYCGFAQNWEPFTLGETHHFSSDSANFPDRSIRIDSARGNLADSVWHFNRLFEVHSWDTSYVNQPQFCQRSMRIQPNGHYQFFDPGNIAVYTWANLGDAWLLDSTQNLTGTVVGMYADSVLGEPDSVKVIEITGGDSLILSKLHGLIKWPDTLGPQNYTLVGIQERHLGDTLPGFDGFFKYKAGDEYYWDSYSNQGGTPPLITIYRWETKMTIDSVRRDTGGFQVAYSLVQREYSGGSSTGYGLTRSVSAYIEDSPTGLVNRSNGEAFRFEKCLLPYDLAGGWPWADLGPAGFYLPLSNNPLWVRNEYWRENDTTYLKMGPRRNGELAIFTEIAFPIVSIRNLLFSQEVKFTEGLGLTDLDWIDFETAGYFHLVGHVIDGDTVGTIWTENYLLGNALSVFPSQWQLFPNPAKGKVNIAVDSRKPALVRILNLTGLEVLRTQIENGKASFDVAELPAGLYLVELQIGEQRDFQKLLIE